MTERLRSIKTSLTLVLRSSRTHQRKRHHRYHDLARYYKPHIICHCGERVDARGLHGLACRESAGRQQRHSTLNEIVWRALGRASIPSKKELLGLTREDSKRRNGATLIPWSFHSFILVIS